jgi:transposase
MKRSYQTDLTDPEWEDLEPYVPAPNKRGRPRIHSSRKVLDAIFFYVLKSGCPWRLLPNEFPPWESVYCWFRKWRMDGTFEQKQANLLRPFRLAAAVPGTVLKGLQLLFQGCGGSLRATLQLVGVLAQIVELFFAALVANVDLLLVAHA